MSSNISRFEYSSFSNSSVLRRTQKNGAGDLSNIFMVETQHQECLQPSLQNHKPSSFSHRSIRLEAISENYEYSGASSNVRSEDRFSGRTNLNDLHHSRLYEAQGGVVIESGPSSYFDDNSQRSNNLGYLEIFTLTPGVFTPS